MLKKIIYFCCFVYLCIPHFDACAQTCPQTEDQTTCEDTVGCIFSSFGCRECDAGKYRTKDESDKFVCKLCDKGPKDQNGADCTGDPTNNPAALCHYTGPGTNDQNNCPWEMTCEEKTGWARTYATVCSNPSERTDCGGSTCEWTKGCLPQEKPALHGYVKPDQSPITWNGADTAPECTYNNEIMDSCYGDGTNTICSNFGYHKSGNQCVSDVTNCSSDGLLFYNDQTCYTATSSNCLSTQGKTFQEKHQCQTSAGTIKYGICMESAIDCNSEDATAKGLVKSQCSGEISGTASLNDDHVTYNFSGCKCVKTISDHGTLEQTCYFNTTGNSVITTDCTTVVTSCEAGYCGESACNQAAAGQYSPNNDKECHLCPAGATSNAGSQSKDACHYTSETIFKDKDGKTFSIPASGNIKIEWE